MLFGRKFARNQWNISLFWLEVGKVRFGIHSAIWFRTEKLCETVFTEKKFEPVPASELLRVVDVHSMILTSINGSRMQTAGIPVISWRIRGDWMH